MVIKHELFKITTDQRPEFYDVTDKVKEIVSRSGIQDGIVLVFSQHTTCSVLIQEDSIDTTYNGTKYVLQDLLDVFDKLIPPCKKEGQYLHPGPKLVEHCKDFEPLPYTLNTDAHLRSSIMGRSETIPVVDGEVQLGLFGRIYFADFDGTRSRDRTVRVQILGE